MSNLKIPQNKYLQKKDCVRAEKNKGKWIIFGYLYSVVQKE